MDKKICELKLDEIKVVVGGAYTATMATAYVMPTSTSLIKPPATFSAFRA